jgi:hypothetical protein
MPTEGRGEEQAIMLMDQVFDEEEELQQLFAACIIPMFHEFFMGVDAELERHADLPRKSVKQQLGHGDIGPASEELLHLLDNTDLTLHELLEQLGRPEMPPDMLNAAVDALRESFKQDYWHKIPLTTRNDIQWVLQEAIDQGMSIKQISKTIQTFETETGDLYSKHRATNVARTESGHMLNSGHASGIDQLANETGLDIRKEWLSVLGSTTRESHAALDGEMSDKEGLFNLEGTTVPWPSHISLGPENRCNCQCTITSVPMMEDE